MSLISPSVHLNATAHTFAPCPTGVEVYDTSAACKTDVRTGATRWTTSVEDAFAASVIATSFEAARLSVNHAAYRVGKMAAAIVRVGLATAEALGTMDVRPTRQVLGKVAMVQGRIAF